jgi:hypothetical protein
MVRSKSAVTILLTFCLVLSAVVSASAQERSPRGRAYLFRGLIGLIDWGMDELAGRINRTGVVATIDSHLAWRTLADQAIADYKRDPKPIAVVGHSIGGDSAISFAERLASARVPVALLITYDPTRSSDQVPGNVERYINLYQSSNVLGGGDLSQTRGSRGHYAAYNLKDRAEIVHVNLDKFERIQEQLANKIRSMGARGEGDPVPIRLTIPANVPIELWDSGVAVPAHAGDTLQSIATATHTPLWALEQLNPKYEHGTLNENDRVIVPRFIGVRVQHTPGAKPAVAPGETPAAAPGTPTAAAPSAPPAPAPVTPAAAAPAAGH